jgi:hypothetical protein
MLLPTIRLSKLPERDKAGRGELGRVRDMAGTEKNPCLRDVASWLENTQAKLASTRHRGEGKRAT